MVAILVITTVLVFALVEGALRLSAPRRTAARQSAAAAEPGAAAFEPQLLAGLFVHPGHTWVELTREGQARVGADEFARRALGGVDRVRLPRLGAHVRQGEPLLILAQGTRQLCLRSPLSGTVRQCREELTGGRQLQAHAWACVLEPGARLGEELGRLRVGAAAAGWMRQELALLGEWLAGQAPGPTMADGGAPVDGFLRAMEGAAWQNFQARFLDGAPLSGAPSGGR